MRPKTKFEQLFVVTHLFRWTLLVIPIALVAGSLVALFLWLLDWSVRFRFAHDWLLFLLPVAGVVIYGLYRYLGKNAEAGNNLIMDEIHEPGGGVPARMAPLVLVTTVMTHLFGGSAGREGTAVQIGGSVAQFFARLFRLTPGDVRIVLTTGIAAGFGAVFGTPVAGAVFALEVLTLGRIRFDALLPCLMASVLADVTCRAWGIHHTAYHIGTAFHFDFFLLVKVIGSGVAFGLAGFAFAETCHTIKNAGKKWIRPAWAIPVAGGLLIIGLTYLLGTEDYLSLGVMGKYAHSVTIPSCFLAGGATPWSWLWKLLFTAITLGTGFKGGEVTPLFFIGAALGNTLATLCGAPVDLMAGLGFIAVFAGATNTPIACTLMGVELFGADNVLYYAIVCFTAYYFSGHSGIYHSQRVGVSKVERLRHDKGKTLKEIRENR
ncbi:voltage-gated chloride channel family protein [Dinghuibacter silviterrae]|uniref:H+/Cl-antiporter ClcA n=1 Tax=Dinghuibacter silviterrae TaxID=1539049 RepID=A0A4R8DGZ1_9BACT|nr:voltage-gated chloride channel family protein [Dinghuibacter silviterrae]TDW96747.1 H+/Cl- antiporter ClcA [Dinghuibacter silviterrae]